MLVELMKLLTLMRLVMIRRTGSNLAREMAFFFSHLLAFC
jgi:hypothetical protein